MKDKKRTYAKLWVSALAAATVAPLLIDASLAGAEETMPQMETVVVTATRTVAGIDGVGGNSITVITAKDLEAKQQTSVKGVLKNTPGLDVISTGGLGSNTSIFLRGADSKNTLVLIDGVMVNDPSAANRQADIGSLTTDNIERIEIVRGPMSVLYGSNATAGVVNIITRKGEGKPRLTVGAEGGAYETWRVYGGSAGAMERFHYSVNVSHVDTEGFSTANDENDRIPHAGNTSEKDGWENTTLSGKASLDLTDTFEIAATLRYLDSTVEEDDSGNGFIGDRFDGGWPPVANPNGRKERHTDTEQSFGRFDINNRFLDELLSSNLYLQASRTDRISYDNDGAESYDFLGDSHEAGWQGSYELNNANQVTAGGSFYREKMESRSGSILGRDAETKSVWAQDLINFGGFETVAGLRYDDHDRFGSKVTYRIAPSYTTDFGTRFKANYGTGFRAPSLFELYSTPYGNPDLDAEESKGWDAGVEQELLKGRISCGMTYFSLNFEDRIDYDFFSNRYNQAPGDTKTRGLETFISWSPRSEVSFLLHYTYTDTEDPQGARLVRRPLNKVSVNGRYRLGKAQFNADLTWVGEREAVSFALDANGNAVGSLDSYTVVNLAGRYDLTERVQVYGRIDNLFDEEYEEAWSYATPGVSAYAGVKVTF